MKTLFKLLVMAAALSSFTLSAQAEKPPVPFPLNEPVHIFLKHDIQRHSSVNGIIKEIQGNWIHVETVDDQILSRDGQRVRVKNRRLGWVAIDAIALVRLDAVENSEEVGEIRRPQINPDSNETRETAR